MIHPGETVSVARIALVCVGSRVVRENWTFGQVTPSEGLN